ncbi:MAG TPA: ATP-binding cassette domain-containing protein, partial [Candidatus Dormibacteraeota bacterium]
IDEVLEIVSLTGRDKDKVKTYSMGMKQRLGLAVALLNDPDLLILDEPRTVWIPRASSRCAICCAPSPRRARRCSFPATC